MDKQQMALAFLDSELTGPDFVASQPEELRQMAREVITALIDVAAFLSAPEPSPVAKAGLIDKLRWRLKQARKEGLANG